MKKYAKDYILKLIDKDRLELTKLLLSIEKTLEIFPDNDHFKKRRNTLLGKIDLADKCKNEMSKMT